MRRGAPVEDSRLAMPVLDPHAAAAHHVRLNRLALSLCGSAQLADDLTQETYLRVLARPRRLRRGSGEFPYLARTLRNVLNDHRRAQRRQPALVSDEQLADVPQVRSDGDPDHAVRSAEVYAAIAALPEAWRDVVAAVDLAGLSYAEAASALRIPVGTVMSRLHRGRARLAGAL
jgi:RNA polymerase sigma-70 factor, ECF subfamily